MRNLGEFPQVLELRLRERRKSPCFTPRQAGAGDRVGESCLQDVLSEALKVGWDISLQGSLILEDPDDIGYLDALWALLDAVVAYTTQPDSILLDNISDAELRHVHKPVRPKTVCESGDGAGGGTRSALVAEFKALASGNLEEFVLELGVDAVVAFYHSCGGLCHHVHLP